MTYQCHNFNGGSVIQLECECVIIFIGVRLLIHGRNSIPVELIFFIKICLGSSEMGLPVYSITWRHNERDASQITSLTIVCSQPFIQAQIKENIKYPRYWPLCAGNSPVTGEFPAQRASNAENVSIWWCHHANSKVPQEFAKSLRFWIMALNSTIQLKQN